MCVIIAMLSTHLQYLFSFAIPCKVFHSDERYALHGQEIGLEWPNISFSCKIDQESFVLLSLSATPTIISHGSSFYIAL